MPCRVPVPCRATTDFQPCCRLYSIEFSVETADCLHLMNLVLSFGAISRQKNWHMPVFGDDFSMDECRNPIIGLMGNEAVSNSVAFSVDKIGMLITGPNMAGKSTFLSTIGVCQVSTLLIQLYYCFRSSPSLDVPLQLPARQKHEYLRNPG